MAFSLAGVRAATITVNMTNTTFSPSAVTINVGDTVTWVNKDFTQHTSTSGSTCSPNGFWGSTTIGFSGTFSHTFNAAGSFPYFCTPHCSFGMTGSVTVQSAAPTVAITNPVAGAVFAAPATFAVKASASAGTTNVQFLVDGASIGNATAAPFQATASNVANGAHTLAAIATAGGAKATNSLVVNVTTLTLTNSQVLNSSQFQFSIFGLVIGKTNVIEGSSTAPTNWTFFQTNTSAATSATFVDNLTNAMKFYRVILLP